MKTGDSQNKRESQLDGFDEENQGEAELECQDKNTKKLNEFRVLGQFKTERVFEDFSLLVHAPPD